MQNVLVRPQAVVVKSAVVHPVAQPTVVQPTGTLCAATVDDFREMLHAAVMAEQNVGLLVDMQQVESIDSDGLMVLVSACKLAKRLGKSFSLCSLSCPVRMVFELTQLDKVFEICEEQCRLEPMAA